MKAHTSETQATITPIRALELLKEGNQRFIGNLRVNRNLLQQANETRDGQWPFATIVSCIDSRTSAELVFDQGLGDVFSIRIAGNVVNTDIIGSLEFACQLAGSKLIAVLGHTRCGAIKGACDHVEMGNLTELLAKIQPAVYEENVTLDPAERNSHNTVFAENVAQLNVRRAVRTIVNRSHVLAGLIEEGRVAVVGGMHDLASGQVTFYEDTWVNDAESLRAVARSTGAPLLRVSAVPVPPKAEAAVAAKAASAPAVKSVPAGAMKSDPVGIPVPASASTAQSAGALK